MRCAARSPFGYAQGESHFKPIGPYCGRVVYDNSVTQQLI